MGPPRAPKPTHDTRIFAKDDNTGEIVELEEDGDTHTLFAMVRYSNSQLFPMSDSMKDQALLDKIMMGFRMSFPGHTPLLPLSSKSLADRFQQDMEDTENVEESTSSTARPSSFSPRETINAEGVSKTPFGKKTHRKADLGNNTEHSFDVESLVDEADGGQVDQRGELQHDSESIPADAISDQSAPKEDDHEEEEEGADSNQPAEHQLRASDDVDEDAESETSLQSDDTNQPPTKKRRRSRGHGWTRRKRRSYLLEDIRDENETQYLIGWKDAEPTWEPKRNANQAAVEAWEEIKRRRG